MPTDSEEQGPGIYYFRNYMTYARSLINMKYSPNGEQAS